MNHSNTIPKNLTTFGERFVLFVIRHHPSSEHVLKTLSKLTGFCEPLCRKITTRATPELNQINHLIIMCEIISKTPREFDENIMSSIQGLHLYQQSIQRLQRKQQGSK